MRSQDNFAPKYRNRQVILIAEGKTHSLDTNDGMHTQPKAIPTLYSDKKKTDSMVVFYCKYAHVQYILIQGLGTTNAWQIWCLDSLRNTAMHSWHSMHWLIVIDSTSAFKGIWEIKPIKNSADKPDIAACTCVSWETCEVAYDVLAGFEAFTNP